MRTDCIVMGVVLVVVAGGCSKSPNAASDGGAAGAQDGGAPDSGTAAGTGGAQDAGLVVSDGGGLSIFGGTGGCKRIGCGQNCVEESDPGIISICAKRPEYACYQQAQCGRQADGKCGFTSSQRFSDCLARAAAADGGSSLSWYETCGAAVCNSGVMNDPNVPDCTTEIAGRPCTTRDALCDLLNHCGTQLQCTDHDPTSDGCPHG